MVRRYPLLLIVILSFLLSGVERAEAEFTTTINVPPDVAPASIGSYTQLNVKSGGRTLVPLEAGAPDGTSTDVEVNVSSGVVTQSLHANAGSTINFSGGGFSAIFGPVLTANNGSTVNILEGRMPMNFQVNVGGTVNVYGGLFTSVIFDTSGTVNVFGGEIDVAIRAYDNGIVNVMGGIAGLNIADAGSTINVSGGRVVRSFDARSGSMVNISGGSFEADFRALNGSIVNISGGSIRHGLEAYNGSLVNVTGGLIASSFGALSGSKVRFSGGSLGDSSTFYNGSSLAIIGREFYLDGLILDGLIPGNAFSIADRSKTLSGILSDGSPFSFKIFHKVSSLAELTVTLAVPEPSSIFLTLMAAGGFIVRRPKKSRG